MKKILFTAGLFGLGLLGGVSASADTVEHTVKSGDTLSHIALDYGTSIDKLAADNQLSDINLIFVGEKLVVNTGTDTVSHPVVEQPVVEQPVYEVQQEVEVVQPVYEVQQQVEVQPVVQEAAPVVSGTNSAKEWIAQKESSGSYTAVNGQYYGRYQLNPSLYVGFDTTPAGQEAAADAYVASRYGSWEAAQAFHMANGWY